MGQRTAKSGGRPVAKWSRRGKNGHRRVLTWFASRWRNHQLKRAEKPHSITQGFRKRGTERPCYEAEDSACRGE